MERTASLPCRGGRFPLETGRPPQVSGGKPRNHAANRTLPGHFLPGHQRPCRRSFRCARLADEVVGAIGIHPCKRPMFPLVERKRMIEAVAKALLGAEGRVRVTTFDGLVVDAARKVGAGIIVRGLRDAADFDYEMQMAGMNGTMAPDI